MKRIISELISAILFCSIATTVLADERPKHAQVAPAHTIIQVYRYNTDLWRTNCNGGIYFSVDWEVHAWCADKSDNLGVGTWRAGGQGRICHNLNWHWRKGKDTGKSPGGETCISHVIDNRGTVWRSWPNSSEWWPVGEHSGLVSGYKFQNEVHQTRTRLGL